MVVNMNTDTALVIFSTRALRPGIFSIWGTGERCCTAVIERVMPSYRSLDGAHDIISKNKNLPKSSMKFLRCHVFRPLSSATGLSGAGEPFNAIHLARHVGPTDTRDRKEHFAECRRIIDTAALLRLGVIYLLCEIRNRCFALWRPCQKMVESAQSN